MAFAKSIITRDIMTGRYNTFKTHGNFRLGGSHVIKLLEITGETQRL